MTRQFGYRHGVAIAQIVVFSVFLIFGILFRIQKKMGWFGISFISTVRIISAGCILGTITNDSRGIWATIFVCESLGLVLLTFVLLDLLKRVNAHVQVLTRWHFRIPELICWAAIGVSIADYVLASKRTDNAMAPGALTRAGVGLFAALYFWSVILFAQLAQRWKEVPDTERRSLVGFAACFPFMVVRIAYTIAYVSTGGRKFSTVNGDTTMYLFMTVLMEFGILGIVVWTLYGLPRMHVHKEIGRTRHNTCNDSMDELTDSRSRGQNNPEDAISQGQRN